MYGTQTTARAGWLAGSEKTQSGTEHATLIFIDFILTPKKANAWKLNRCRSKSSFAWQARDYIKLARRQNGAGKQEGGRGGTEKKGFIMAICLNS